jgi:hypothetical protein
VAKPSNDAKVARKIRDAVRKERERIRRSLAGYLYSLHTARSDEFGHGWNSALLQVESGIAKKETP